MVLLSIYQFEGVCMGFMEFEKGFQVGGRVLCGKG